MTEPLGWSLIQDWLWADFPSPEALWIAWVGRILTVLALPLVRRRAGYVAAFLLLFGRGFEPLSSLLITGVCLGVLGWATRWQELTERQLFWGGSVILVGGALALAHSPSLRLMGWEHGSIARSLASGRGFADAMGPESGPTAWMPPFLPCVYAGLYLLTPDPAHLALLFGTGCLVLALALVLEAARRSGLRVAFLFPILLLYGGVNYTSWLADNHDVPLLGCLTLAVLLSCWDLHEGRSAKRAFLTALVTPLASPVLTLAYGLILALLRRRTALLVMLALALPMVGWTVRNYLVLGRVYVGKSNLWFDFVQANLLDDDGVPTGQTFLDFQPCNHNAAQREYYRVGEAAFLDLYRIQAAEVTAGQWLRRVGARAVNALWWLRPTQDVEPALPLPVHDQLVLFQEGTLTEVGGGNLFWVHLDRTPSLAQESWRAAVRFNERRRHGLLRSAWSWVNAGLPFGALLVALRRRVPGFQLTALLYALILLPYLAFAHYERYQLTLSGLQILLVFYSSAPYAPPSTRHGPQDG